MPASQTSQQDRLAQRVAEVLRDRRSRRRWAARARSARWGCPSESRRRPGRPTAPRGPSRPRRRPTGGTTGRAASGSSASSSASAGARRGRRRGWPPPSRPGPPPVATVSLPPSGAAEPCGVGVRPARRGAARARPSRPTSRRAATHVGRARRRWRGRAACGPAARRRRRRVRDQRVGPGVAASRRYVGRVVQLLRRCRARCGRCRPGRRGSAGSTSAPRASSRPRRPGANVQPRKVAPATSAVREHVGRDRVRSTRAQPPAAECAGRRPRDPVGRGRPASRPRRRVRGSASRARP